MPIGSPAPSAPLKWTFWSVYQEQIPLINVASDRVLPDVVLPDIPGRSIQRVYAVFRWRATENTSIAVNRLAGPQSIRVKKSDGEWGTDDIACIDFLDDQFKVVASTREQGGIAEGTDELSSEVDSLNATYNFRWEDSLCDGINLIFNDIQVGLVVEL